MHKYSLYNNDSKEDLICATLLGMMETQPYYKIKVTDLIKRANISRSTFYVYFDSIFAVLQKIEDDYLALFPDEETTKKAAQLNLSRSSVLITEDNIEVTKLLTEHIYIYRLLSSMNGEPYFQVRLRNRFMRICRQILNEEVNSCPEDRKQIISLFFAGGRLAVMDWWMHHADNMICEDLAGLLVELYTKLFNLAVKDEAKAFSNNILFSFSNKK